MTIQSYVGTSSLDYQIANTLQLCSIKNPVKLSELKKEACEALGLDFGKNGMPETTKPRGSDTGAVSVKLTSNESLAGVQFANS